LATIADTERLRRRLDVSSDSDHLKPPSERLCHWLVGQVEQLGGAAGDEFGDRIRRERVVPAGERVGHGLVRSDERPINRPVPWCVILSMAFSGATAAASPALPMTLKNSQRSVATPFPSAMSASR
jgi:hypothetical protein